MGNDFVTLSCGEPPRWVHDEHLHPRHAADEAGRGGEDRGGGGREGAKRKIVPALWHSAPKCGKLYFFLSIL